MTKKQKRAAEKKRQDRVTEIGRYYVTKTKAAVRMGYWNLSFAAGKLYANPVIPPSPYEVKLAVADALADCIAGIQQEITAIRSTL